MLTGLRHASVVGAAVLAGLLSEPFASANQPTCQKYDDNGFCVIWAGGGGGSGGGGGDNDGGGTGGSNGGGGTPVTIVISGTVCTPIGLLDPQPPKIDPVWEGHTGGAIYGCQVWSPGPGLDVATLVIQFWAAVAPAPLPPDPRVLAEQAVASMRLKAVNIGIVPEPGAGSVGIIGMPTWMWADAASESTWGPIRRTASAAGFTVTAVAKANKVVWNMGDGRKVTCTTQGTPYQDSYGKRSSPDCGHTYTRQGRYAVSATSYWTVTWTGIGQSGVIPLDFTRTTSIAMGESQVINR